LNKIVADIKELKVFLEQEVKPLEVHLINSNFEVLIPAMANCRRVAKESSFWNFAMPKEFGGQDMSLEDFAPVSELLGTSPLGHFACNVQAPDIGNMELLLHFATDDQKERFLKPLAAGEIRSCFGMTEPEHAGSNPVIMSTSAKKTDGGWMLNGHKWFTTGADGAAFCIVMAVTNPDEVPHKRAGMFIVPTDSDGFTLQRNISIMGDAGRGYFTHGEVLLTDCFVPDSNLIGNPGDGFKLAQNRLGPGRIHHCMRWIGIAERVMEMLCKQAISRQITPSKTLADLDITRAKIAENRARIDACRALVHQVTAKISGGSTERAGISTIKFLAADMLMKVVDDAIQIHGGLGVTDDTLLSFWYRHERGSRIYDGPDEVHKLVVAKEELKKYAAK
jgi:acyl-CoA dehydrogenase